MIPILVCKLLGLLGRLLGRGSSLPGAVALKLDKNILGKLTLPGTVVAVTGSNGKTSTTELIRAAAEATGKKVICNSEGSNQIEGVATLLLRHSNLKGEVQADIAVIESDERFCQYTFSYFSPDYIVITNLYRDQTTRNGTSEFVAGELAKGLPADSVLVINADDPLSASLGYKRPDSLWYGIDAKGLREPKGTAHAYDDGAFCPVCHSRMRYRWRLESHLGDYTCPACGFARPKLSHAVTDSDGCDIVLDKGPTVTPQICNTMFAYNIAAAYTVARAVFALAPDTAAQTLTEHTLSNRLVRRVSTFDINGHPGLFILSKHENSMAYNGAIRAILDSDSKAVTVVVLVDLLSRKYVANDMSWLWDIDFEHLADNRVRRVIAGGLFANDLAVRLLAAGIDAGRLSVQHDLDAMMDALYAEAEGDVFLLTCFTDIGKFQKRLRGGAS